MKFLQADRLDDSDDHVYKPAARAGELAVTGSFVFSFAEEEPEALSGKAAQAFRHGFLGLESFGWTTLVRIVEVSAEQYEVALQRLARHLVESYGAPSIEAALPGARQELEFASGLCEHPVGTLLALERSLEQGEIHEAFKRVHPREQVGDWEGSGRPRDIWNLVPERDSAL